jgi:large subunit ribosomal protein L19
VVESNISTGNAEILLKFLEKKCKIQNRFNFLRRRRMPVEKKKKEVKEAEGKVKKENKEDTEKIEKKAVKKDKEIEDKKITEGAEEKESAEEKKEANEEQLKNGKAEFTDLNYYSKVRKDLPEIKIGNVVRVSYRVIEGGKERIQIFEGIVIALKNIGISRTVTVRKTSFGVAVERIFPVNSKLIQQIQVKKHSKVRRAKLYYLRKLKGKAARLKEMR